MTRTLQGTRLNRDGSGNLWLMHALVGLSLACSSEALPLNEVDESTGGGAGKTTSVTTTGTSKASSGSSGGGSNAGQDADTDGTSSGTSFEDVLQPPAGGGEPRIFGELDGEAIDITGEDDALGFGVGANADLGGWTTSVPTGDAAMVYLWSDGESTQGLLEIAPADPAALQWVCLDDVQISADETTWSSSKLSRLGSCDLDDGLPLDISLSLSGLGGPAQGSFRGEPIEWSPYGAGNQAGFSQFLFDLDAGRRAALVLHLPDDQIAFNDGEYEVSSTRLVIIGGEGAAACGGSGAITNQGDSVSIDIDEFSALRSCPGDAADGQLSGGL